MKRLASSGTLDDQINMQYYVHYWFSIFWYCNNLVNRIAYNYTVVTDPAKLLQAKQTTINSFKASVNHIWYRGSILINLRHNFGNAIHRIIEIYILKHVCSKLILLRKNIYLCFNILMPVQGCWVICIYFLVQGD